MPLGGSHERRNVPTPWKVPSLAGRPVKIEGELWSLGGEHDNRFVEGKTERHLHGWSIPPLCTPQPETLVPGVVGGWVLKLGLQRSTWGENWDWLSGDSLKGLEQGVAATEGICRRSLSQPKWQGTIVGGCTRRGVGPHRKFFPHSGSQVTGRPTQALRVGMSPHCHHGLRRWVWVPATSERIGSECQSLSPPCHGPRECAQTAATSERPMSKSQLLPLLLQPPGVCMSHHICTPPIKGITTRTC